MATVDQPETWCCPSCEQERDTPFCSQCGERKLDPYDLTVRKLASQLWAAISNLDARLLRSLRLLLTKPGELTADYLRGHRRLYLGPVPLFLFANAAFFAVQSLAHSNVFSSSLDSHLHNQDWSDIAQVLVAQHLAARGTTLAAYTPIFDAAVVLYAKSLIIIMALAFAALLPLAFPRERKPLGAHVIFSLHLYVFILLLFCASLLIVELDLLAGGQGLASRQFDIGISAINLAAAGVYLHYATKAVYGAAGVLSIAKTALLASALAAIVLGYRFLIFLITLALT